MVSMNLINRDYIEIEWLQKELIDAKCRGELKDSLQSWWRILSKWRRKNEADAERNI